MNKRDAGIVWSYNRSKMYSLAHAYANASGAKERAWTYCCELLVRYHGSGLKVIGANTYMFSAGFTCEIDGQEYLMYITPTQNRLIKLEEDN